jgi:cyclopropane fatty-acyl-phospholipid synthase-like methyltransferase
VPQASAFDDLAAEFRRRHTDAESLHYLAAHRRRWELLLALVLERAPERILDVGASYEADAMRARLPGATVDSLGWLDYRFGPRDHERHVEVDLNDAQFPDRLPELDRYDLVVAAEVLEHLYTAPTLVLRYLASALEPQGALILQTPNAVALKKRLQMVVGRNPAEPIRENRLYAGHFHEYTIAELRAAAAAAGLEVERCFTANYFWTGSRKNALFARAERWVPAGLRDGITMVLRANSRGRSGV